MGRCNISQYMKIAHNDRDNTMLTDSLGLVLLILLDVVVLVELADIAQHLDLAALLHPHRGHVQPEIAKIYIMKQTVKYGS